MIEEQKEDSGSVKPGIAAILLLYVRAGIIINLQIKYKKMSIYYKTQVRVTKEMVKDAPVNDEFFQREMAHKIIKDMSIEHLQKLFKFEKFDPFSIESEKVLLDKTAPDWHKTRIMHFREIGQIEYEGSVTVA